MVIYGFQTNLLVTMFSTKQLLDCSEAGIGGYRTNHSLRATAATRLYQAGVHEQLIIERKGHRSLEGVRSYKHTSGS